MRESVFSPISGLALARWLALSVVAAIAPAAAAQSPAPVAQTPPAVARPVKVIEINGAIRSTLLPGLHSALESVDPDRYPAGVLSLLDSPGGDGLAALEIGRMARSARAHVFVRSRCSSACVFILASGVVRGVAANAIIGIHKPRLTTFVAGLGVVDVIAASNPNAAKALAIADLRSEEYLREMGIPDPLFKAMMAAPSDQMRILDGVELAEFGLSGIDAAYREGRSPGGAATYKVSEVEFVQRTLLVAEKCLADKLLPQDFVRCYRRVLRSGE